MHCIQLSHSEWTQGPPRDSNILTHIYIRVSLQVWSFLVCCFYHCYCHCALYVFQNIKCRKISLSCCLRTNCLWHKWRQKGEKKNVFPRSFSQCCIYKVHSFFRKRLKPICQSAVVSRVLNIYIRGPPSSNYSWHLVSWYSQAVDCLRVLLHVMKTLLFTQGKLASHLRWLWSECCDVIRKNALSLFFGN